MPALPRHAEREEHARDAGRAAHDFAEAAEALLRVLPTALERSVE